MVNMSYDDKETGVSIPWHHHDGLSLQWWWISWFNGNNVAVYPPQWQLWLESYCDVSTVAFIQDDNNHSSSSQPIAYWFVMAFVLLIDTQTESPCILVWQFVHLMMTKLGGPPWWHDHSGSSNLSMTMTMSWWNSNMVSVYPKQQWLQQVSWCNDKSCGSSSCQTMTTAGDSTLWILHCGSSSLTIFTAGLLV